MWWMWHGIPFSRYLTGPSFAVCVWCVCVGVLVKHQVRFTPGIFFFKHWTLASAVLLFADVWYVLTLLSALSDVLAFGTYLRWRLSAYSLRETWKMVFIFHTSWYSWFKHAREMVDAFEWYLTKFTNTYSLLLGYWKRYILYIHIVILYICLYAYAYVSIYNINI